MSNVQSTGQEVCPVCGKIDLSHPAHTFRCHEIEELWKKCDALQANLDIAVEALKYYAKLEMREIGILHNVAEDALKKLEE